MLSRMNRHMYLFLAIQEIVSKTTCESNKDTNKQAGYGDDLFPLSPLPSAKFSQILQNKSFIYINSSIECKYGP